MESRSSIPTLINNGPETINVVMYDRYVAPTDKFSAQGRLHPKGIILTPGEFTQFLPGTTSIDIYYAMDKTGLHFNITSGTSYTIYPTNTIPIILQDKPSI